MESGSELERGPFAELVNKDLASQIGALGQIVVFEFFWTIEYSRHLIP